MPLTKRSALLRFIAAAGFVLTLMFVVTGEGFAEKCVAPTLEKQAAMTDYIAKKYHYETAGQLRLVENAQANENCYWRLSYKVAVPKGEFTYYLSPDGQYLVPALFDLTVDPLAEERRRSVKLARELLKGDPPSIGSPQAPVTIVEFTDFECPFCKSMTDILEKGLTPAERANVRVVFRNFPLSMHPWAKDAAEIAGCAALQSDAAFWKVHDYLFENQKTLTTESMRDNVTAFAMSQGGVEKKQLQTCLDKRLAAGGVTQDVELGTANAVRATPTLFINGKKYEGMKDIAALRAIIVNLQTLPQPTTNHAETTSVASAK